MIGVDDVMRDKLLLLNRGLLDAEAERRLRSMRLALHCSEQIVSTAAAQAAILSTVNVAARSFRGGIEVVLQSDVPLSIPLGGAATLTAAVTSLGGSITKSSSAPAIVMGDCGSGAKGLKLDVRGGIAGVVPAYLDAGFSNDAHPLAAILSAGLAVGQHFRAQALEQSDALLTCLRYDFSNGLTPSPSALPKKLWFIGLGHLGQAYLWTLSLLQPDLRGYYIILQDYDGVGKSTASTSILTFGQAPGTPKIEYCAEWLRVRGATVQIVPEPFGPDTAPRSDYVVVAGLHDAPTRMLLDRTCGRFIVDAGIGGTEHDFMRFMIHRFPAAKNAEMTFRQAPVLDEARRDALIASPAYKSIDDSAAAVCGLLTNLAATAVGSSFVGLCVSTLVMEMLMRNEMGGATPERSAGDLFLRNIIR